MRSLGIAALAAGLAVIPLNHAAAADSEADQQRWDNVPRAELKVPGRHLGPRWGHRVKGRWYAGHRAPGGWGGYRFATRGYQLPTYWVAPRYAIAYQTYGLPAPQAGYSWSRYYDDAVLIDRDGRVLDTRRDIQWDRYEGGYDGDYDDDRGPPPPSEYGANYRYDEVTGGTEGTWEGTWKGQYDGGRPYEYSGSFDGEYRPAGAPYPPPYGEPGPDHAPGHNPAIIHQGSHVIINGMAYPAGGTVANGFYYPPVTTTTITVHSGCCQHTEPAAVWKPKPKKYWKPKSKIIRMTK